MSVWQELLVMVQKPLPPQVARMHAVTCIRGWDEDSSRDEKHLSRARVDVQGGNRAGVQVLPWQQARALHVTLAPQLHTQRPKSHTWPLRSLSVSLFSVHMPGESPCALLVKAGEHGGSALPGRRHMSACHRNACMMERLRRTCMSLGSAPGASGDVRRSRLRLPALLPSTTASSPPPRSATCCQHSSSDALQTPLPVTAARLPVVHLHGPDTAVCDPGGELLHCCALNAAAAMPHLQVGHRQAVVLHASHMYSVLREC